MSFSVHDLPVIVWDVDDVLNHLMRSWFETAWLPMHPACTLQFEDILENPPHKLLGISLNAYLESLDTFRLSHHFSSMSPNREILEWFKLYGEKFNHIALTATPECAFSASSAWVFQYFGRWIRSFHVLPSRRAADQETFLFADKGDYLKWLNKGDVMVEDNIQNAELARQAGLSVILMPRPWNHAEESITNKLSKLLL